MISALLKGLIAAESRIIAGLFGGDMNAINQSEHELHNASDVDLKDVWEDIPAPPVPILKPFQKDTSYGRVKREIPGVTNRKAAVTESVWTNSSILGRWKESVSLSHKTLRGE
jgi:tyrosyl-DNA phosphodiesterase 2